MCVLQNSFFFVVFYRSFGVLYYSQKDQLFARFASTRRNCWWGLGADESADPMVTESIFLWLWDPYLPDKHYLQSQCQISSGIVIKIYLTSISCCHCVCCTTVTGRLQNVWCKVCKICFLRCKKGLVITFHLMSSLQEERGIARFTRLSGVSRWDKGADEGVEFTFIVTDIVLPSGQSHDMIFVSACCLCCSQSQISFYRRGGAAHDLCWYAFSNKIV